MSNGAFMIAFVIGAAMLALWVDARFPRHELSLYRIAAHAIVAVLLLHLVPGSGGSAAAGLAIVFALVLPALVYVLLTAVWFVRLTQNMLGTYR